MISLCLVAIQSLNLSKYNVRTLAVCRIAGACRLEGCSVVKHKDRQASTFDAYTLKYALDDDHTTQLTALSMIGSLQGPAAHFSLSLLLFFFRRRTRWVSSLPSHLNFVFLRSISDMQNFSFGVFGCSRAIVLSGASCPISSFTSPGIEPQ